MVCFPIILNHVLSLGILFYLDLSFCILALSFCIFFYLGIVLICFFNFSGLPALDCIGLFQRGALQLATYGVDFSAVRCIVAFFQRCALQWLTLARSAA